MLAEDTPCLSMCRYAADKVTQVGQLVLSEDTLVTFVSQYFEP